MGKRKKLFITFDEQKRRDYLTGFRKRKQERRTKARFENENKLKEEIRNVKQAVSDGQFTMALFQYHSELMKKLRNVALPSFLANDLNVVSKRTTTDTGEHTVSVEEINIAQSHYFMGDNWQYNSEEGSENESKESLTEEEKESFSWFHWETEKSRAKTRASK
ncbi:Nucleolar protein 12, partial [Taenia solium]